ncbi:polyprenyl synthetase family protein [Winogradskyella maritima]|uniref:Polyprenyl synthetase family protein n=1 Tax=Winogradskyella maritima TaxID=1517766 RepID=A0ABV8AEX9_9FLAO|nr:polyprenyl synthetase family protein [Winogradskyella maritima]
MYNIQHYQQGFLEYLKQYTIDREPKNLYEPANYILNLGGKRLRPVLALMACDCFGANYKKALDVALAIEVFHNFTLVHDDIMDAAPLRRGKTTVHKKWDENTGILSGDAMLIMAYQCLESYEPTIFSALTRLFSKTALEVCEGQQYDIDFETRQDVSIIEYLKMIEYKTAVLVGATMQMGALVAGASNDSQKAIYDFGRFLGIAFQLQDDYLDTFGNPETFGKQVGGDIIENKKTYLYLIAQQNLSATDADRLNVLFKTQPEDPSQKIELVKALFENSGAKSEILKAVENYTKQAFEVLKRLNISEENKAVLKRFGQELMGRSV